MAQVKCIKERYNSGEDVCLGDCEVHTVANVLKTFLRDLQQPILSFGAYPTVSHWNGKLFYFIIFHTFFLFRRANVDISNFAAWAGSLVMVESLNVSKYCG